MKKSTGLLTVAVVMVSLALGLVSVGLATESWLVTVVDRANIQQTTVVDTSPLYYSRNRGLIRTCFPGTELSFLDSFPNAVDGWCLYELGYELTRSTATLNLGSFYEYRIHLMRAQFVLICLALIFILISSLALGNGCLKSKGSSTKVGAVLAAIGGFCVAVAMAIFHGIEYIENEKITTSGSGFPASYATDSTYTPLARYSKSSYGYSYFVCWVGALTAFIGAIIGLCTSYNMTLEQEGEKSKDEDEYMGSPEMAYGAPEAAYAAQDPSYLAGIGYPTQDPSYPGAAYPAQDPAGFTNYAYDPYNTYGRY